MTAAAIPQPSPIAPDAKAMAHDPSLAMEETIRATLGQVPTDEIPPVTAAPAPAEAVAEPIVRDDGAQWNDVAKRWTKDGQFVAGEAPVIEAPAPAAAAPAGEAEVETVEIPEGYVAVPTLDGEKSKAFKVFDTDGEVLAPDLKWELTANGKPRTLTTDTLVAYAQMGVYNHEREQAHDRLQQQSQQIEQRAAHWEQQARQYAEDRDRLLSDPDYLVRAVAEHEANNTPEARAQRERQQHDHERQQWQFQQAVQESQRYVTTELEPVLEQIHAVCPEVGLEELAAKLYLYADRYRVQGVLMPQGFTAVGQHVVNDLVPWARQLNTERVATRGTPPAGPKESAPAKVEQQANAKITQAQVRAQRVRRAATGALKPAGRAMPDTPAPQPIRTAKDAESAVIGNTMAALRAG